jgi:hypothetical protein
LRRGRMRSMRLRPMCRLSSPVKKEIVLSE